MLRPPPDVSLYHRHSNPLFPLTLQHLGRLDDVHAIVLPRTEEQREYVRSLDAAVGDRPRAGRRRAEPDRVRRPRRLGGRDDEPRGGGARRAGLHDLRRPARRRRRGADPAGAAAAADRPAGARPRQARRAAAASAVRARPAGLLELLLSARDGRACADERGCAVLTATRPRPPRAPRRRSARASPGRRPGPRGAPRRARLRLGDRARTRLANTWYAGTPSSARAGAARRQRVVSAGSARPPRARERCDGAGAARRTAGEPVRSPGPRPSSASAEHAEQLVAEAREPRRAEPVDRRELGDARGRRASSSSIVRSGKITYAGTSSARARSSRQRRSASAAGTRCAAAPRRPAAPAAARVATPSSARNGLGRRDHVIARRRFARVMPT